MRIRSSYRWLDESWRSLGAVGQFLVLFAALLTGGYAASAVPGTGPTSLVIRGVVILTVVTGVLFVLTAAVASIRSRGRND